MTVGGGEAADQMLRMMLSGGEVAVRLGGSALKNLLALTMALAKNNQTVSGKVNMTKMLRETRDLRLFPMSPEQYIPHIHHNRKAVISNHRFIDPKKCHSSHLIIWNTVYS